MTKYLDWKIGDFVVCVSDKRNVEGQFKEKIPDIGKIYTIRNFFISQNNKVCIRVQEIVNPVLNYDGYDEPLECGFRAEYFRRLDPAKISMFTEMLTKTKDKVDG